MSRHDNRVVSSGYTAAGASAPLKRPLFTSTLVFPPSSARSFQPSLSSNDILISTDDSLERSNIPSPSLVAVMHILLTLLAAFFSIPVTGSHLYKRAYTYQCADLTGVALYVTVDGSPYYAGDIQTCGCASEQWVSEEIENSGDDAIYNAEQAAGLDATVTAVSNLVSRPSSASDPASDDASLLGVRSSFGSDLQLPRPRHRLMPAHERLQLPVHGRLRQVRHHLYLSISKDGLQRPLFIDVQHHGNAQA